MRVSTAWRRTSRAPRSCAPSSRSPAATSPRRRPRRAPPSRPDGRRASCSRCRSGWRCSVEALVELGDLDGAEAQLAESGLTGAMPATYWFTPVRFARAHLLLAQGRPREAADELLHAARQVHELGMVNTYYPWRAQAALALAAVGETSA